MSDSEQEESIQSYESDEQDNFKEYDDDDYQEHGNKPKIKIGALLDEDIVDDPDDMEYGGMDSDEEDFGEDDLEEDLADPKVTPDSDEEDTDDDTEDPTQIGRVIGVADQVQINADDEDVESTDEDSSDEEEEGFFQKLDKEVLNNYIDVFHPESRVHNYDEVRALATVTRNRDGVIIDELHRTLPFMTKFEKARILGIRSKQLNEGAKPFVKTPPNVVTGYAISILELAAKKIPFIIRRPIPNGGSEYWRVSDLELIN